MAEAAASAKHVLVVDDTEEIVALFREVLEGMGHRVSAMTFAPDDLQEIRRIEPDLVILDLVIGGEKVGWQLAQKMRMARDTEGIPIVLCTSATDDVREQEGWLTSKTIKILLKPFTVDDLEVAVTKALLLPDITAP